MIKEDVIESVGKMIVNGNRLELPTDETFANYAAVKKCLINAGGKYNKCGFIFKSDAEKVQAALVGGEVLHDKKKFQFFATPSELAEMVIEKADIRTSCSVLEPSAGQGALADLAHNICHNVTTVEIMPENIEVLKSKGYSVIDKDFLSMIPGPIKFNRIVMNPPFTKNQDIAHIRHAYDFLRGDGVLVSVASPSWIQGSQKKQVAFREWLSEVGGEIEKIGAGAFKSSGTNVSTVIIRIIK